MKYLKEKLQLKHLELRLISIHEENFGVCPNGQWMIDLLQERSRLRSMLLHECPNWYSEYDRRELKGSRKAIKGLQTWISN